MVITKGTLSITGENVGLQRKLVLNAATQSYLINTIPANLQRKLSINPIVREFSITGLATDFHRRLKMDIGTAEFVITTLNAALELGLPVYVMHNGSLVQTSIMFNNGSEITASETLIYHNNKLLHLLTQ